jgi:putative ABC transport system permease protein
MSSPGSAAITVLGPGLWVALVVFVLVAAGVSRWARLGVAGQTSGAAARALVQLAAVSAVIVTAAGSLWRAGLFVAVMFGAASWTSASRIADRRATPQAALSIAAGALPVLTVMLLSGAVPLTGISVIPIAGIVLGGAMSTTSLAGRLALDELVARYDEYEAWLALGMPQRDAALMLCRPAGVKALIPSLDQTRTVGLVTLPGAFVGVLLGSGDPVQAGAAQLLVLVGLLAAQVIAVAVTVELVARSKLRRR